MANTNTVSLPVFLAASARVATFRESVQSKGYKGGKGHTFDATRQAAVNHGWAVAQIAANAAEPEHLAEARANLALIDLVPECAREIVRGSLLEIIATADAERAAEDARLAEMVMTAAEQGAALAKAQARVSKEARTDYQVAAWAAFEAAQATGVVDVNDRRAVGLLSWLAH